MVMFPPILAGWEYAEAAGHAEMYEDGVGVVCVEDQVFGAAVYGGEVGACELGEGFRDRPAEIVAADEDLGDGFVDNEGANAEFGGFYFGELGHFCGGGGEGWIFWETLRGFEYVSAGGVSVLCRGRGGGGGGAAGGL